MNPLYTLYCIIVAVISLSLWAACRAARRQRPNYWRSQRLDRPDPNCTRSADWRVHTQREHRY